MRSNASHQRTESFEQYRQRMLDDTSRFIEWGLANPDQVEWIPRHRVGQGDFPERLKTVFWSLLLTNPHSPD